MHQESEHSPFSEAPHAGFAKENTRQTLREMVEIETVHVNVISCIYKNLSIHIDTTYVNMWILRSYLRK